MSLLLVPIIAALTLNYCVSPTMADDATVATSTSSPPPTSTSMPHRKLPYSGMTFTNERYCPNVSLASPAAEQSLRHLATTGANFVAVVVTQYQMNITSTDIFPVHHEPVRCTSTPHGYCVTATDLEVRRTIRFAKKELGFGIMLKLQIDLIDAPGSWRGDIGIGMNASQWTAWFISYERVLSHYARIAQEENVELLSVSCELVEASGQETHWRRVIKRVREIFKRNLTAAANWAGPNGGGEVTDKQWWDAVDIIGVDEYYVTWFNTTTPSGAFPTLPQLLEIWKPIEAQLEGLSQKWNRTVLFTEIGYCSGVNGSCFMNQAKSTLPPVMATPASQAAQATQFEAALLAMSKYAWFEGVFWWNWATDPAFGGPGNSCMDPKFKPAEHVLRRWYQASVPMPAMPSQNATCRCWL